MNKLSKLHRSAFSNCHETLSKAQKVGVRLTWEIMECVRWQVICVDLEHLRDKEWREITKNLTFRANILFACVDEVHLINKFWLSFHPAFSAIGTFFHGRFPASISVVGLSATLEPGAPTMSVCKSLNFFEGNLLLIWQSNAERVKARVLKKLLHPIKFWRKLLRFILWSLYQSWLTRGSIWTTKLVERRS